MKGTVASLLADIVEAVGTGRVYGVVGTSVLGFLDELYDRRGRLEYITTRHEQVAVSMADAESRVLNDRMGVAVVHAGPGFLNAAISLGIALKDRVPLLLITGGVKRRLYGTDSWLEVDQKAIAGALARKYIRVSKPEDAGQLADAVASAWRPPRGPVVVEVPEDAWSLEVEYSRSEVAERVQRRPRTSVGREAVDELLGLLEGYERPLLLVGGEGVEWGCKCPYEELAERLGAYIVVSGNGRGGCSEDHSRCLGRVGFGGGSLVADKALEEADIIVSFGHELDDITTYAYTLRPKGDIVFVTEDPVVETRPLYPLLHIKANPLLVAEALRKRLTESGVKRRKPGWDEAVGEWRTEWAKLIEESLRRRYEGRVNPAKFFHELDKRLPRERIVTGGQGTHILYTYNYLRVYKPRSFLAATNLGAMGYALPAAIAAKKAHPDHEVVAVVGDGELMMVVQDLETIAREHVGVKIVLVNDNSYRVLLLKQMMQKMGRIIGTTYTNPDFVKLAEAFGVRALRVESDSQIGDAVKELVEASEPLLVELVISQQDLPPLNLEYTLRMG